MCDSFCVLCAKLFFRDRWGSGVILVEIDAIWLKMCRLIAVMIMIELTENLILGICSTSGGEILESE